MLCHLGPGPGPRFSVVCYILVFIMLATFYEKSREEIRQLLIDFLNADFYAAFPELKDRVSIIVTGSVAYGRYDEHSDIDIKVIFLTREQADEYKDHFREHKRRLTEVSLPIQLHSSGVYDEIDGILSSWRNDGLLREMSQALVINDPGNVFRAIQEKYSQYPENVRVEKLKWLFAELILQIEDRWKIAAMRGDAYFCLVTKLQIVKFACITLQLLHKRYPSYDKHLYLDVISLTAIPSDFRALIDDILSSDDPAHTGEKLASLVVRIEVLLSETGMFPKESREFWLAFRSDFSVSV